jgi:hypothetical protein
VANRLIVRELTSVGLVPDGDNPEAVIEIFKRKFTSEQREAAADKGQALPDGSFPIVTVVDLRNAVSAFGRSANQPAARRHITKRAKALGRTDLLPETWGVSKKARTGHRLHAENRMDILERIEDDELRAEVEKALAERDAQIAELTVDDEPEVSVLKDADDATRAAFEKQQSEIEQLRKQQEADRDALAKERRERELEGFVKQAEPFEAVLGDPAEAGAKLQALSDAGDTDWLIEKIGTVVNLAEKSDLLKELGAADSGTAKNQVEALAKEKQADNPDLTDAQARVLVRKEHPELKQLERVEV